MTLQASFAALHERIAAVNDVLNATSLLTWDSRTMMPAGGAETRGQQIATLTRLARDLLLASETEQALGKAERAIEGLADDAAERRMVEQTRYAIEHHRRVPASLIQERAALRTVAQAAWIEGRSKSDFSIFAPFLEKTVELSRSYADCIGWSEHPYDAMVSIYEPGETARSLKVLFSELRNGLLPILDAARSRPRPRSDFLYRDFPDEGQRAFGLALAEKLGYDFKRGRLDTTVHPFEVSFTRNDVRITTRYNRNYLPASMFGTATRSGMRSTSRASTPPIPARPSRRISWDSMRSEAPASAPMKSQSRLWENHVVRSLTFWQRHFQDLQRHFPDQLGDVSAEEFYRAVTRVEPGFIRVEADELTYDFHIMLRAEIECALMDGSLPVSDLPEAWNAAIRRDLGLTVPNNSQGVLQDVHWSTGYIGSFPTYTVGNVMGAQVMETLRRQNPSLDPAIEAGNYAALADELRTKIWQHGRRFTREELLVRETGRGLDPAPYLSYLRGKYAA